MMNAAALSLVMMPLAGLCVAQEADRLYGDFDMDGEMEILSIMPYPTSPGSEFHEWRLYDSAIYDESALIFAWNAREVSVYPAGSGDLIKSDDAFWYISETGVRPYGGLVADRTSVFVDGNQEDADALFAAGMSRTEARYIHKMSIDLDGDGKYEKMIAAYGPLVQEDDMTNPYIFLSPKGEVLFTGMSIFEPWVFPGEEGVTVINESANGFSASIISWENLK